MRYLKKALNTDWRTDPALTRVPVLGRKSESFTATIQRLERENKKLAGELDRARSHSESLMEKVEEWEAWAPAVEEQLRESQDSVARLDEELSCLRARMAEAVKMLQKNEDTTRPPNQKE